MLHPIVYLPVELQYRELDSRLMTATHLLNAGVSVVIGQQWAIFQNHAAWQPGVILFKTVNNIQAGAMASFHAAGHAVVATDEEVLTCVRNFCFMFSPQAADNCHLFFAQSDIHRQAVANQFPQLEDKIVVSGNPRIEITSKDGRKLFQAAADEIRRDIGPFILFNSNFASINSIWGGLDKVFQLTVHAGVIDGDDPHAVDTFKSWMQWEAVNRKNVCAVLEWAVNNLPSHKVVIRPHPGEQVEFWQKLANGHPRVVIVPKSHPIPWLMASDLLVHTSCTTGLEAALLDRPVLNIESYPDPVEDRITSLINPTVKTAGEAITAIDDFLRTNAGPLREMDKCKAELERFFPGYHDGGASRRIAKECVKYMLGHDVVQSARFDWSAVQPHYKRRERSDQTVEKMTISFDDFMRAFTDIRARVGGSRAANVSQIDDSLFVMEPKA